MNKLSLLNSLCEEFLAFLEDENSWEKQKTSDFSARIRTVLTIEEPNQLTDDDLSRAYEDGFMGLQSPYHPTRGLGTIQRHYAGLRSVVDLVQGPPVCHH